MADNFLISLTDLGGCTEILIREAKTLQKLNFKGTCYVRPDGAIYAKNGKVLAVSELDNTHRCIIIDTSNWSKIASAVLEIETRRPDGSLNLSLISMTPLEKNIIMPGPQGTVLELSSNNTGFLTIPVSSFEITGIISLPELRQIAIADSDGNISIWDETPRSPIFSNTKIAEVPFVPFDGEGSDMKLEVEFE